MTVFCTLSEECMNREKLLKRALFFFNHKIYVYPIYLQQSPPMWSKTWNGFFQNEEVIERYDWYKASGVYAVVGKKGIRAIKINTKNQEIKSFLIEAALCLLDLPCDYCWVLDNSILVESPDDRKGNLNSSYNNIEFIWQGYATLSMPVNYYCCPQRIKRPQHVSNEKLFECVRTLEHALKYPWCNEIKRKIEARKLEEYKTTFPYSELTKKEYKIQVDRQGNIPDSPKPSLWKNIIEILRCLGQIIVVLISITLILFVGGYLTRGCESNIDTDHVHFERFHQ